MKNQYFADRRDLPKYDLLLDLVESLEEPRLTYIPMLTPDDGSREGQLRPVESTLHREEVHRFLQTVLASANRDVRQLRSLFGGLGLTYMPHREDQFFVHADRKGYFESIPSEFLYRSVVFIDPDIGLTIAEAAGNGPRDLAKYIFLSDLEMVWRRASEGSVLVIYQHLQRNAKKRAGDVSKFLRELSRRLGGGPFAVWRGDLAFLVAGKGPDAQRTIEETLRLHADTHGLHVCRADEAIEDLRRDKGVEVRPSLLQAEHGECEVGPAKGEANLPTVSRFFGIEIRMYWREHPPAHFHAIYAEHEATVAIETLEVVAGSLPRRALILAVEWAMMHRPELRENWQRAATREPMQWIRGLDEEA